jgi:hypothetical protein
VCQQNDRELTDKTPPPSRKVVIYFVLSRSLINPMSAFGANYGIACH